LNQYNYSLMASAGHSSTQAPHSVHSSALITAMPFAMLMASAGHASTHSSHPVHSSAFIFGTAMISSILRGLEQRVCFAAGSNPEFCYHGAGGVATSILVLFFGDLRYEMVLEIQL
jgi:hypothetical protein